MTDETQQAPCAKDPAPQPTPPPPKGTCKLPPAGDTPPKTKDPDPCPTCCDCGSTPTSKPDCLDELIAKEATAVAQAESAKAFKTELEDLQKKSLVARAEYTEDKYKELLDRWKKEDAAIVGLIKKLVCAVPCWRCVLECLVCPLLHDVRKQELLLYGDRKPIATVGSWQDERYWWQRERDRRAWVFGRIKLTMTAWENPAKAIDKVMTDNTAIIGAVGITPKDLFDVFFKLIPMHLAIAPPVGEAATGIAKKYVELCECGPPLELDDCCGPNVGERTVRQRLNDPLPYLIKPDAYADLICCLAGTRYHPAKQALAEADGALAAIDAAIAKITADIAAKLASLPGDAKNALSVAIDCDQFKPKGKDGNEGGTDSKPSPNPASSY